MRRREFLKLSGAASLSSSLVGCATTRPAEPRSSIADPWIEIDAGRIVDNLARVRARVNGRPVMAVIKADAYGHGLVGVGRALERAGVAALAVGKFDEAMRLREAGVRTPILNFGAFSSHEVDEIVRRDISQSVYTDDYRLLAEAAGRVGRSARVHVKIDTGLGRIGVPYDRAGPLIDRIGAADEIEIAGVFTPFTEDDDYDRVQLTRLLRVCDGAARSGIPVGLRHAASSAGVLAFPQAYLDMVRPGIALYGEYPSTAEARARKIDLQPAMTVKTRVLYVKTLRAGDTVSYHRAFVAERETRVATLAIGYSDGYPHRAAGKASALIGGQRCPVIGLVTSNHLTVDATGAGEVAIGQEAVLLGAQGDERYSAEELAAAADTSVYKILIRMNPLLPRRFV